MKRFLVISCAASAVLAAPASAAMSLRARAEYALERAVERRYPKQTRDRQTVAECKRRTRREFFCLYGVLASFDDAVYDPDTRWVFSNVGYVRIRHGRLVADPFPPRRGGDYAPA